MLARLEALQGVSRAETNYAGDLLRLSIQDEAARGQAELLLRDLGYEGEVVSAEAAPRAIAWYDARSVGELSQIEAGVIADRIVPPFAQEHHLSAGEAPRLRAAVVAALHGCFLRHSTGEIGTGAFRNECVRVTVEAVRATIGADQARALGEVLDLDLAQDHRSGP